MESRARVLSRRGLILKGAAASALSLAGGAIAATGKTGGVLSCSVRQGFPELLRELTASALTDVDSAGHLSGVLASEWQCSSDGCTWDFRIRADQTFHDGAALTPDAIAASLGFSAAGSPWAQVIRSVDSVGRDIVRVTTLSAFPSLPFLLAEPEFRVTAAFRDAAGVGTGSYRIRSATDGRVVLARATGAGSVGFPASFERLILQDGVPEGGDALRYADAEIGIFADRSTSNARRGVRQITVRRNQFALTLSVSSDDQADLLEAMAYGLDWSPIGQAWLGKSCHLATDPAWRGACAASASQSGITHDPDRARQIVRNLSRELEISVGPEVMSAPRSNALLRGMATGLSEIGLVPRFTAAHGNGRLDLRIRATRHSPAVAKIVGQDPNQRLSFSPLTLDSRAHLRRTILGEEGTGVLQWSRA